MFGVSGRIYAVGCGEMNIAGPTTEILPKCRSEKSKLTHRKVCKNNLLGFIVIRSLKFPRLVYPISNNDIFRHSINSKIGNANTTK